KGRDHGPLTVSYFVSTHPAKLVLTKDDCPHALVRWGEGLRHRNKKLAHMGGILIQLAALGIMLLVVTFFLRWF
ncbi:MAG: hypothetical protein ACRYG7_10375, partial [Janthinobacterium lividum]